MSRRINRLLGCSNELPPAIYMAAQEAIENSLPTKSRNYYRKVHSEFEDWKITKNVMVTNETVLLAYFNELSKTLAPPTLWSKYSILKTMIMKEENLDLGKYEKLKRYLRERNVGFQPKKSSVFTRNELNTFFIQAPDHKYLGAKAAAGMAISGACRRVEIKNMKVADVVDNGDFLTITVKETKTHVNRTFTINNPLRETILDYMSLRPTDTAHDYLFVNYQNGKCTRQAMGINKIGKIPEEIASWLNLDNPETYTGHSFRRTSATWLIDGGGSLEDLKRHGTWKSSTVAEGYIADSIQRKRKMNDTITNGLFGDGTLCVDPLATKIKRRITAYRETRSQPSSSTSSSSQSSRSSTNKPTTSISWSDSSNRRLQESNSKRGPSVNISLNDCCLQ